MSLSQFDSHEKMWQQLESSFRNTVYDKIEKDQKYRGKKSMEFASSQKLIQCCPNRDKWRSTTSTIFEKSSLRLSRCFSTLIRLSFQNRGNHRSVVIPLRFHRMQGRWSCNIFIHHDSCPQKKNKKYEFLQKKVGRVKDRPWLWN